MAARQGGHGCRIAIGLTRGWAGQPCDGRAPRKCVARHHPRPAKGPNARTIAAASNGGRKLRGNRSFGQSARHATAGLSAASRTRAQGAQKPHTTVPAASVGRAAGSAALTDPRHPKEPSAVATKNHRQFPRRRCGFYGGSASAKGRNAFAASPGGNLPCRQSIPLNNFGKAGIAMVARGPRG